MLNFLKKYWPVIIFFAVILPGMIWFTDWRHSVNAREATKARVEFHQSLTAAEIEHIEQIREKLALAVRGSLIKFRDDAQQPRSGKVVHVIALTEKECVVFQNRFRDNEYICPDNEKGLLMIDEIILWPADPQYGAVAFEYWTQKYAD